MQRWPRGLRPHGVRGTLLGAELLYFVSDEQWVMLQVHAPAGRGASVVQPWESRHDDLDAQRRLARAVAAHLERDREASVPWLRASVHATSELAALMQPGEASVAGYANTLRLIGLARELSAGPANEGAGAELMDLVDGCEAELGPAMADEVAVAGILMALATGEHSFALASWARHGARLEARDDAAAALTRAVMQAFVGDRTAARSSADAFARLVRDFVDARAAGELYLKLGLPAEACPQFVRTATDVGTVHDHARVLRCANLAGIRTQASKAAAAMLAAAATADERLAAARGQVDAGAFEQAEATLELLLRRQPEHAATRVLLASLLLWSGRDEKARAHAETLLEAGHDTCEVRRILGAAALLAGDITAAVRFFDEALAHRPADAESLLFSAEAKVRAKDYPGAYAATRAWVYGDHPVWQLLRVLVEENTAPGEAIARDTWFIGDSLLTELLGDDWKPAGETPTTAEVIDAIGRALSTLGGNRGLRLTQLGTGGRGMRWIDEVESPRRRSERLMTRLPVLGADRLLAEFAALERRWPGVPFTVTYAAELRMWHGEYQAAHELFAAMWRQTRTRWGYVGTGACQMLLGRYDEALEDWRGGLEYYELLDAEATWAYRGELHRLRGDLDEAVADLEFALVQRPTRLGALANLALAHVQRGDEAAAGEAAAGLVRLAPAMVWLARADVGLEPSETLEVQDVEAVVERLLTMMRGNRSSVTHTLVDARGQLRIFPAHDLAGFRHYGRRCAPFAEEHLLALLATSLRPS